MPLLIVQVLLIAITIMAAESIGLFALAIIYVGETTAFMLHGIWHWLTRGYRVRDPALVTDERG